MSCTSTTICFKQNHPSTPLSLQGEIQSLPSINKLNQVIQDAVVDVITRTVVLPRTFVVIRQEEPELVDFLQVATLPNAILRLQV